MNIIQAIKLRSGAFYSIRDWDEIFKVFKSCRLSDSLCNITNLQLYALLISFLKRMAENAAIKVAQTWNGFKSLKVIRNFGATFYICNVLLLLYCFRSAFFIQKIHSENKIKQSEWKRNFYLTFKVFSQMYGLKCKPSVYSRNTVTALYFTAFFSKSISTKTAINKEINIMSAHQSVDSVPMLVCTSCCDIRLFAQINRQIIILHTSRMSACWFNVNQFHTVFLSFTWS